jgi:hypothetical protein
MKVGELCERLHVPYRHARYVLEQGILPPGVEEKPGRGEHRDLTLAQAFWLGIVLMLKQNGIQAPLAGKIAEFARESVRGIAGNLSWDPGFNPFLGKFGTEYMWFVDIGDLRHVRMATTADPSYGGKLREFPWWVIGKHRTEKTAAPVVIIRLDISRLALLLRE